MLIAAQPGHAFSAVGAGFFHYEVAETIAIDAATRDRYKQLLSLALAATACGILKRAKKEAVSYALARKQFGQPIARFQAIQWMIADIETDLLAGELLLNAACIDAKASDRALFFGARAAQRACDAALQVHGGYGYTTDYPIERFLRAAQTIWAWQRSFGFS